MQEMWARSLRQEDSLEMEMASHSSILAWEILCTKEPVGPQSMGMQGSDKAAKQQIHIKLHAYIIIISIILVKMCQLYSYIYFISLQVIFTCRKYSR